MSIVRLLPVGCGGSKNILLFLVLLGNLIEKTIHLSEASTYQMGFDCVARIVQLRGSDWNPACTLFPQIVGLSAYDFES